MKTAIAALLLGMSMPVAAADDTAAIRAARDRYNMAIAAHDAAAVRAAFIDNYTGIAGSNGEIISGGDAMAAFFAKAFRTPGFIAYVRTPDVIGVATPAERAMERGHWVGTSRRGKTEIRITGEYLAIWVPTADGWRLRSETFVTLGHAEVAIAG